MQIPQIYPRRSSSWTLLGGVGAVGVVAVLLVLGVASLNSPPPIGSQLIGQWKLAGTDNPNIGSGSYASLNFEEDGGFQIGYMLGNGRNGYTAAAGSGTWTIEDNQVITHWVVLTASEIPVGSQLEMSYRVVRISDQELVVIETRDGTQLKFLHGQEDRENTVAGKPSEPKKKEPAQSTPAVKPKPKAQYKFATEPSNTTKSPPKQAPVDWANDIGMKLVLIPAGEYLRGNELPVDQLVRKHQGTNQAWFSANSPQHRVIIDRDFYLAAFEVTEDQFAAFQRETKYIPEASRSPGHNRFDGITWTVKGNMPAVNITWNDASEFCKWLGRKENRRYRLPADAEWEYACRAGTTTEWSFGAEPSRVADFANVSPEASKDQSSVRDVFPAVAPVGSFPPNRWGLYDMHGNVSEWVQDWAAVDYQQYARSAAVDPAGPTRGVKKLLRGGNWGEVAVGVRSAITNAQFGTSETSPRIGFRVVCEEK